MPSTMQVFGPINVTYTKSEEELIILDDPPQLKPSSPEERARIASWYKSVQQRRSTDSKTPQATGFSTPPTSPSSTGVKPEEDSTESDKQDQ